MSKMFPYKLSLLIFSLLACCFSGFAQFEEGRENIYFGLPRLQGVDLSATGPNPTNTVTWSSSGETSKKITNIITFRIKEDSLLFFRSSFSAVIYFTVDSKITIGSSVATSQKSLTVHYDTATTSKYNVRAYIVLPSNEEVKITVDSIRVNGASGWDPRKILELENEMRVLRYYTMSSNTSTLAPSFNTAVNNTDAISVSWTWNSAAYNNMSQLEWAWVEDEMFPFYANLDELFLHNSTRVDLDFANDAYSIPLLYDGSGKLYYRVRAAYRKNNGSVITGPWSSVQNFSFSGHEPDLNWQSNSSFAENGKSKTVIQYFDGSLRSRQTVTKDNSTGNTVVAETIYDLQGRPNLQILPTPTIENTIKYFSNFNRFNGQASNTDPANFFDLTPAAVQCNRSLSLDSNYGNAKYYSNQNPWLATEAKSKYIPDARGYAFTETRFMDDATERVRSQSGVGVNHQVNSGHETNYFYGKPAQPELDALFGTEAGDASHYTKNMVRDANGQLSISYVDMHGRTIGTALAGDPTAGIDSIINSTDYPLAGQLRNHLLNPQTNIILGNSIEAVNTILVSANGNYHFTYKLDPAILEQINCTGQDICFDCKYDLEISVKSEACGDTTPIIRRYHNLQIVPANEACGTSMFFKGPGVDSVNREIKFTEFFTPGSYVIRKTLTINDSLYSIRKDSALKEFLCRTEQSIYDSVVNILYASSGCGLSAADSVNCVQCLTNLGLYSFYRNRYLQSIGISLSDTSYDAEIRQQYRLDSLDCVQACSLSPQLSTLAMLRRQMLNDMHPFTGQYAIDSLRDRTTGIATAIASSRLESKYNIFTTASTVTGKPKPFYLYPRTETGAASHYFDDAGEPDATLYPNGISGASLLTDMGMNEFSGLFQPGWTSSLIFYHPEFSKLKFAETTMRTSYEWLDRVLACETWASAVANNFHDPLNNDPYFVNNYVPADETTMQGWLNTALPGNAANPTIWEVANGMVLCNTLPENQRGACILGTNDTGIEPGLSTAQQDQVWENFKTLYISYRNEMVVKYINSHEAAVLSQANMQTLQSEGKQLVFATNQDIANQNGATWWAGVSNPSGPLDTTGLGVYMNSNSNTDKCLAQKPAWKAKLKQCEVLRNLLNSDNPAAELYANFILDSIVNEMVKVCRHSINPQQPYGASNVEPGYTGLPQNFEQAINTVLTNFGIATLPDNNYYCNPYTIDYPKPYGLNPPLVVNHTNIIDSCNCVRFAALKLEAGSDSATFSSMNQFLKTNYKDSLTLALWNGLQLCDSAFRDSCRQGLGPATEIVPTASNPVVCSNPSIDSVIYLNQAMTSIKIKYDTYSGGNCDTCVLKLRNTRTGTVVYYGLDCELTNGEKIFSVSNDSCDKYEVQVQCSSEACGPLWSKERSVYICGDCDEPVIHSVTLIPPNPTVDSQQVSVNYTSPPGSSNCLLKIYWLQDNYYYQIDSISVPCSGNGTVNFNLAACYRYAFLLQADLSDSLYDCSISVSDTTKLDSCYQEICTRLFTPIQLGEFVVMPSFLGCDYKKPCITCGKLDSLTTEFRTIFPAYSAVPHTGADNSPADGKENSLWARFLNYRTGFSKNVNDYTRAWDSCHSSSPPAYALCAFDPPINDPSDIYPRDTTPCRNVEIQAHFIAQQIYQQMKDSLINRFDSLYRAACFTAKYTEQFYVEYVPKEYHYTLYYYDQAGNLVKTLPPSAVKPNYGSSYLASVIAARDANTEYNNSLNNENLATNYRYNSLNQVIEQRTPDAGTSRFWYDRLGRLAISQNARQYASNLYSYTLYDALGRITEVGQKPQSTAMTQVISQDTTALQGWIAGASPKTEITTTVYDIPYDPLAVTVSGVSGLYQQNLRNRVSYSHVKSVDTDPLWDAATFYSYDIHGNVDTLLQDHKSGMGSIACSNDAEMKGNRFKKIVYDYDLISGKVNTVSYQLNRPDQYYHRYGYDAENRLTEVYTSRDRIYWEREASYDYYRHGPLARTVLGQNQVQGLDYAYTIQGWLKGVNSTTVDNGSLDMGQDGKTGSIHSLVARDVFGFSLNYFNDDYQAIQTNAFTRISLPLPAQTSSGISTGSNLYNGNIAAMAVNVPKLGNPLVYGYRYDQLNRIKRMDAITGLSSSDTTITAIRSDDYHEEVTYDPNGNIRTYNRNGFGTKLGMDSLEYEYIPNTNKLKRVSDHVSLTGHYASDIDNQADAENYVYDAIGNLIKDKAEGIDSILWNVYGKIAGIRKSNGTIIDYGYDAGGNRISKSVTIDSVLKRTFYVRDATGNVMSLYEMRDTLKQKEIHLYGSSRLGINQVDLDVQNCAPAANEVTVFTRGNKYFELSNHLGNVLAVVSDKKLQQTTDSIVVTYYTAAVVSAMDYYPFGMLMPGRNGHAADSGWTSNTGSLTLPDTLTVSSRSGNTPSEYRARYQINFMPGFESGTGDEFVAFITDEAGGGGSGSGSNGTDAGGYRYGFNGKENDNEVKGEGNQQDYGMRIYDPRLGRFLSVDPLLKDYPEFSAYQYAESCPIKFIDLEGAEAADPSKKPTGITHISLGTPLGIMEEKASLAAGNYFLFKNTSEDGDFYTARLYHKDGRFKGMYQDDWIVGPESLNKFISNAKDYEKRAQGIDLGINMGGTFEFSPAGLLNAAKSTWTPVNIGFGLSIFGKGIINLAETNASIRPTWQESEQQVMAENPGFRQQVSFKNGKEVANFKKGSVRPEGYKTGTSIEVKNYKIITVKGQNRLVNNVVKQAMRRISNLPKGTHQKVVIEMRGNYFKNNSMAVRALMQIKNRIETQAGSQNVTVTGSISFGKN